MSYPFSCLATSLYTVSGKYQTATANFQIRITPPISPPRTMLSATTPTVPEIPNPIGISVNILPMPKGTPQASHIRNKSIVPLFTKMRLNIEYKKSATTTGSTEFLRNDVTTYFFVIDSPLKNYLLANTPFGSPASPTSTPTILLNVSKNSAANSASLVFFFNSAISRRICTA